MVGYHIFMIAEITFRFQDTFAPDKKSLIASIARVRSIILTARDFIIVTSDTRVRAHLNLKSIDEHNSTTRYNRGILDSIVPNVIRIIFYCAILFNLFFIRTLSNAKLKTLPCVSSRVLFCGIAINAL